jgi:acetyltransferase-like isoleucine patch superfamily enzyme
MQTDFTNGDKYIKQHYPNTKCIFQKGILGPRTPFLKIGDGSSIHDNFLISCNDTITLGRHVGLANGVFLSDANHIYHNKDIPPLLSPNEFGKPIRIDDFCWLGINTVVLPGVSIGKQCVVAANSVVTKDVPDYTMVIGNPARHLPLKSFFHSYEKRILKEEQT